MTELTESQKKFHRNIVEVYAKKHDLPFMTAINILNDVKGYMQAVKPVFMEAYTYFIIDEIRKEKE